MPEWLLAGIIACSICLALGLIAYVCLPLQYKNLRDVATRNRNWMTTAENERDDLRVQLTNMTADRDTLRDRLTNMTADRDTLRDRLTNIAAEYWVNPGRSYVTPTITTVDPALLELTHTAAPHTPWATLNGQRLNITKLEMIDEVRMPRRISLEGFLPSADNFLPISIFGDSQPAPPVRTPEGRLLRRVQIRDSATAGDTV